MIAIEKVRHYGETVAAVIAENRYVAEDACELIEVVYEQLPVVLDPVAAREDGSPLVHEALGTNTAYERTFSFGEVDKAFADADRSVTADLYWPRSTGMPMDTNGAIGDYDPGTGVVTIHANSMNFTYFLWLIAGSLKIPASKLRLVPVVAGGSFGSKFFMHKVPTFAGFLSMLVGKPVKYVEDRRTHIVNNDHCGSDRRYGASLAFDDDGEFKALRISCVDDYGAYLQFGTGTHGNALSQIVGPYRIQHVEYSLAAVLTNKNQQGAYRGFGAEVSNWILERLVDMAARDLDLDRVEIRRRNLIPAGSFPYRTPTGNIYDSGNYQGVLAKVLEEVDYDHWVAYREQARAEGRHVGIGVVASQERSVFSSTEFWFWFDDPQFTPTSSPESASVRIDPTGRDHRHAPLAVDVGQQPRDGGVAGRRRGVRRRSGLGRRQLRRLAERAPGNGSRRVALHRDGVGRRRRRGLGAEGQDPANRERQARGRRGRPRVPRRRRRCRRRARPSSHAGRDRADGVHVPARPAARHAERARRPVDLRPSADDASERRSLRSRHLLPVRRPRLAHRGDRGRRRDRQARVPPLRRRPRRGHDRQPAHARRPGDRRHGAGPRHGAVRGDPLRRRSAASGTPASSTTTCRRRWTCRR